MRVFSLPLLLAGVYLVGLAVVAVASPQRARQYLASLASTRFAHFLELFVRLLVGAALVMHAPQMRFAAAFAVMGWVIVATTAGLLVVPWTWHQRFARWSVPLATRNLALVAVGSLAGGVLLLVSVIAGPAP